MVPERTRSLYTLDQAIEPRDYTIADYISAVTYWGLIQKRKEQLILLDYPYTLSNDMYDLTDRAMAMMYASYLPYADFSIYNATYYDTRDRDSCSKCKGAGGSTYAEYQGDPPMGATVDFFEPCEQCIGAGLCPGCMQPLAYTFDLSAFGEDQPIVKRTTGYYYASNSGIRTIQVINPPIIRADNYEGQTYGIYEYDAYQLTADEALADIYLYSWFSCTVCGWAYDAERLNNYYDDSGDYDYPALDADQYFT